MTNFEVSANDLANKNADLYGVFPEHTDSVKQVIRDTNPNMDDEEVTRQAWTLITDARDDDYPSDPEDAAASAIARYNEYKPPSTTETHQV